ncbi:cyclic nucleotide-binding domain-containing protein [Tengunoibacter tsumagoiensis]|nr:cyclic nucleotide-binding domain-containing protein [Tengunoibacter tsumagoiensis]
MNESLISVTHRADIRPLSADEIQFEINMCIGCDRCLRACPLPSADTLTIAELNMATISPALPDSVARFTDECVMCGSCVPVCPVDNHRDLLMLSLKKRLGLRWEEKVEMHRVLNQLPNGWSTPHMLQRLREQALFRDERLVANNYLLHLVASSSIVQIQPGELLFREGEFGRELYFVLDGLCQLSSQGPDGKEMVLGVLRRGEYIGEQGMLNGQPRPVTVLAQSELLALKVPEQVMQHLIEIVPAVKDFFEQLHARRLVQTMLQRLPLFQGVSENDLEQLAQLARIKRYARDEQLFSEEGRQVHESLHLILDGFVRVGRRTLAGTGREKGSERIIAYRQSGDYFVGGLDMLGDRKAVTVATITRAEIAEFERDLLMQLFQYYPEVLQRFQERLHGYKQAKEAAHSGVFEPFDLRNINTLSAAEARAGLHSLVSDGVVEGTDVLVIDLDKCIHCNECEEACERRHGHSRMNRTGMVVGNISIATACRQCQDPVCMLCSRAGIARMPGGEVYITESCIGCGICAERCPYDNISIVELSDRAEQSEQKSWQQFSRFFLGEKKSSRAGKPLPMAKTPLDPGPLNKPAAVDALSVMRKKIAIKCDLCAGYNNQACVEACPTGAAIRVNPVTFFGSTEQILRKRAR